MSGVQHLGAFLLAALLVIVVPGPATLYVLGQLRLSSWRAAQAVAGLVAGDLLLISAAGLGLGALLQQLPAALLVLRIGGALYVGWLGLTMLHSDPQPASVQRLVRGTGFGPALWLTLFNPKPVLFFGAFFPLFLAADGHDWLAGFLSLGLLFELLNMLWFALLIAGVALLKRHARVPAGRWVNRAGGLGLLGCAALMLWG
jgi:threonine/homoserine/homoserine lactone efflux protein